MHHATRGERLISQRDGLLTKRRRTDIFRSANGWDYASIPRAVQCTCPSRGAIEQRPAEPFPRRLLVALYSQSGELGQLTRHWPNELATNQQMALGYLVGLPVGFKFTVSAQVAVRVIAKVAEAYKLEDAVRITCLSRPVIKRRQP